MAVAKLDEIVAEFADLEPRERLELLLEFTEKLPPLPERFRTERDAGMHRISECQTPTFIWVELVDGRVQIFADCAPEAPTVKGFVSILADVFNGSTPEEVAASPDDLLKRLGLLETLGMVRMRGLAAIQHYIRNQVQKATSG
ncbi:MAG TPA: SufE family protein [Pirellulales bacterium]|jgi:cysteine desulfuration protein SufE